MKHYPHAEPRCGMCGSTNPIDYGLMCGSCRSEDRQIERMFSDYPKSREPEEMK